jgi:DNA-binding protein HU-beta
VNLIDINKREAEVNKAELVEEVSGKVGITKKDAGNVVDAVTGTITNTLKKDEKVTLVGFGTFDVMHRKTRRGVNPQTRKTIQTPAKEVPKFMPGKSLRETVK